MLVMYGCDYSLDCLEVVFSETGIPLYGVIGNPYSPGRTVKLTEQAIEALKGYRARQNEERLRLGSLWEDHNLVFPNRIGKPMNADNLYHREFVPPLKKAGLTGFTFHSLRHTCATLLCSKNVNPKIVQEMMGHANISQTMDTYSHVMPGMGEAAATALEEALS